MLSAESASGRFPVEAVAAMADVCAAISGRRSNQVDNEFLMRETENIDDTAAVTAIFAAARARAAAIVIITDSCAVPLRMSRYVSSAPIYVLTNSSRNAGWMSLFQNVNPLVIEWNGNFGHQVASLKSRLIAEGKLRAGDVVIVMKVRPEAACCATNFMHLSYVES